MSDRQIVSVVIHSGRTIGFEVDSFEVIKRADHANLLQMHLDKNLVGEISLDEISSWWVEPR